MAEMYTDSYAEWAADYDLFGEIDTLNVEERAFLDKTLAACGATTVLDCACGTGQHLVMLSGLGYEVYGSDFSEEMLAVCRATCRAGGSAPRRSIVTTVRWRACGIGVLMQSCA